MGISRRHWRLHPWRPRPPLPNVADGDLRVLYWQAPTVLNLYLSGAKDVDPTLDGDQAACAGGPDGSLIQFGRRDPWPGKWRHRCGLHVRHLEAEAGIGLVGWHTGHRRVDEIHRRILHGPGFGCSVLSEFGGITSVEALDGAQTVRLNFAPIRALAAFVGGAPILQQARFARLLGHGRRLRRNFQPPSTPAPIASPISAPAMYRFEINPTYRDAGKTGVRPRHRQGGGDAIAAARAVLESAEVDFAWNLQLPPESVGDGGRRQGRVVASFGSDGRTDRPEPDRPLARPARGRAFRPLANSPPRF